MSVAWCEECEKEVPLRQGVFLGHGKPATPEHRARTGETNMRCGNSHRSPLKGDDLG